jgi:hypothetical protein
MEKNLKEVALLINGAKEPYYGSDRVCFCMSALSETFSGWHALIGD